jgi:asparagine synthase (glutamine-hydrolysing)
MPGLCGFAVTPAEAASEPPAERLRRLLENLRQHPRQHVLPAFADERVAAGLVLRREGLAGAHWTGPDGVRVWVDGEAFDDDGLMPPEALAAELARGETRLWNGAFSAVAYDPVNQEIRFVTDPYGLRHLYVRASGDPAWCGDLTGFLAMPGPAVELRAEAVGEFLEHGHLSGDGTWFRDVELLGPGLVLTYRFDTREWSRRRYFELEKQGPGPSSGSPSYAEATRELGRLFRRAVERRSADAAKGGLTLSGGLDSRAVLAALPPRIAAPATLTFGKPGCADEALARAACAVRGARHAFVPLGGDGWLAAREEYVRLTNGQISILHLHGLESLPTLEALMDVCHNGFLGDALLGGSYLDRGFLRHYLGRGRRFILQALHYGGTSLAYRLPFMDAELLRYALALPRAWLRDSRIYRAMLLREFPGYFRAIPWENTGLPISASRTRERFTRAWRGVARRVRRAFGRAPAGYADYADWLRQDSAQAFLRGRLEAPDALVTRWVPAAEIRARLDRHLRGADESEGLARLLTVEIWLRALRAESPRLFSERRELFIPGNP